MSAYNPKREHRMCEYKLQHGSCSKFNNYLTNNVRFRPKADVNKYDTKMKILYFLILFMSALQCLASTEANQNKQIVDNGLEDDWATKTDWSLLVNPAYPNQAMIAVTQLKNPNNLPILQIYCSSGISQHEGYDIHLNNGQPIELIDPEVVPMIIQLDEQAPLNLEWFVNDYSPELISTVRSRWLIKEMINAKIINVRYRDKNGLQDYSYSLKGLSYALDAMENECLVPYYGNESIE